jgi:hypothetical protein
VTAIRPLGVNHMNLVLDDMAAGIAHLGGIYGTEHFADLPQPSFAAALVQAAHVILELFVPNDFLLSARQGAHHVGLEYQADMEQVRAAIAARGMRMVRDVGAAVHTHPADCFGVAYEFYGKTMHDHEWPLVGGTMRAKESFAMHPLGLTGLKGYTHAVADIAAAGTFLEDFLSAELLYDVARPAIAARARGYLVAGSLVELVTPSGDGALLQYMLQHGEGIRSTILEVRDLAQARGYLEARGLPIEPGTLEGGFAVAAEANLGLIFEFVTDGQA